MIVVARATTDALAVTPRPGGGTAGYAVATATRLSRLAGCVGVLLVMALAAAPFVAPRALLQQLSLVFLLSSMAQCWNLLAGQAGLVSVGQQAFVGLGGYALFALVVIADMDALFAVPLAGIVVAVLALPLGGVTFRVQGPYFAVVTWVMAEVARLVLAQWKALGGGTGMSLPRTATSHMAGLEAVAALLTVRDAVAREIVIYWAALVLAVMTIVVVHAVLRSRLGLALAALRDDAEAAESVGVGILAAKFKVYVLAGLGAGLAGALIFLQKGRISPDAAFSVLDWSAYVIFIVVIGGIGTIEGPIVGTLLFVVLQNQLAGFGPWYLILLGGLGIAVMLLAPRGLWGALAERYDIHLFPTRRRLVAVGGPAMGARAGAAPEEDGHA